MANRYDIGKPSSSHRQDRNNGAETLFREYNFNGLERYAMELGTIYHLNERILEFFHPKLAILEPSQMPASQMPAQTIALSNDAQYDTEFLREESYNMSIIDLNTVSRDDHISITQFLISSLFYSSGGTRGPMIIHIFCYDEPDMLTPLNLSVILLQSILKKLYKDSHIDRKSIRIACNGSGQDMREYEITMEILRVLISRILKDYPEDTMHFVFGGIRSCYLTEGQQLSLARFMIDMGGLVRSVLPRGDMRKVKCTFSGNALSECVLPHLRREEEQRRGLPQQEAIFRQMLMLALYKDRYQNFYYERVRFGG